MAISLLRPCFIELNVATPTQQKNILLFNLIYNSIENTGYNFGLILNGDNVFTFVIYYIVQKKG